ncbi:MAG: lipocalin family protein [Deltaproteobacteria bacterium]|nr:lipocalin family protein [Deltaproteobacteria bacterium]
MRKVLFFTLAMLFTFIFSCGSSEDSIVGTWKPVEYYFAGEKQDDSYLQKTTLEFHKDGTGETTVNGMKQTGTYTVDGNTVTLKTKYGPITYQLEGDTLKIDNPATKATYKKVK